MPTNTATTKLRSGIRAHCMSLQVKFPAPAPNLLNTPPSTAEVPIHDTLYRHPAPSHRQRLEVSCTRDPIVLIMETPQAVVVLANPVVIARPKGSRIVRGLMTLIRTGIRPANAKIAPPPMLHAQSAMRLLRRSHSIVQVSGQCRGAADPGV